MKSVKLKLVLTIIALLVAFLAIRLFYAEQKAEGEGVIYLQIIDENQQMVFDDQLTFFEGETFYDILDRIFTLTCADRNYQPDATCSYTFPILNSKAILGIKNEHFDIMTNWWDTLIEIELHDGQNYYRASHGVSHLPFEDESRIRLKVSRPWGGT